MQAEAMTPKNRRCMHYESLRRRKAPNGKKVATALCPKMTNSLWRNSTPESTPNVCASYESFEYMMMDMCHCKGDGGRAYYVKGHVDIAEFKAVLANEVDKDDPILAENISHCWMRFCRDFQQEHSVIAEAEPNSRGAFRATWVQDS